MIYLAVVAQWSFRRTCSLSACIVKYKWLSTCLTTIIYINFTYNINFTYVCDIKFQDILSIRSPKKLLTWHNLRCQNTPIELGQHSLKIKQPWKINLPTANSSCCLKRRFAAASLVGLWGSNPAEGADVRILC
jgi:hypothetical protein